MRDTWRCERGSKRVFDDVTGEWTEAPGSVVYDGPGRLRDQDGDSPRLIVQGETTATASLRLSLPVRTSGGLRIDDVLECTDSPDESMLGLRARITDLHIQSDSSARRFSVVVESWPTT
jgi:hypothetical protein